MRSDWDNHKINLNRHNNVDKQGWGRDEQPPSLLRRGLPYLGKPFVLIRRGKAKVPLGATCAVQVSTVLRGGLHLERAGGGGDVT